METIHVYADFDFLPEKEEIGALYCERVRGKERFSFEFSRLWLSRRSGILLSGDVMNVRGRQHAYKGFGKGCLDLKDRRPRDVYERN